MCQEFPKEKWVDARREDVLDAPYFHVVFTVPEELNPVIYSNQKLLYDALYHASSDTLRELASDSKYLGADIGYICILHTWGSEMNFHPHIHAVVSSYQGHFAPFPWHVSCGAETPLGRWKTA